MPKFSSKGRNGATRAFAGNLHRNGFDRLPACGHEDYQVLLRGKSTKRNVEGLLGDWRLDGCRTCSPEAGGRLYPILP